MDAQKILVSISEPLIPLPLTREQRQVLALQLMAWFRLSEAERLAPEHRAKTVKDGPTRDIVEAAKVLDGQEKALRGMAALVTDERAPAIIRQVLDACSKLDEQGHLQSFDPRDVIAEVAAQGELNLSPDLADLMVGLLEVQPSETAYCAWDASGQITGRLLPRAASVFTESLGAIPAAALMAVFSGGQLEEATSDPLRDPKAVEDRQLRPFDVAVGLPSIGEKLDPTIVEKDLYQRFNLAKASRTVLAIQHLLAHARRRVVVAVPNSVLFNASTDAEFRRELLMGERIQAVIALPPGSLRGSSLPLSLLVLSKEGGHRTTRFINADVDHFRTSQSRTRVTLNHLDQLIELATRPVGSLVDGVRSFVADVPVEQVLENDAQLQVQRYLIPKEQQDIEHVLKNNPLIRLDSIFETVRPMAVTRNSGSDVRVLEVSTSDLPAYGSIVRPSKAVEVTFDGARKADSQFLRPNDIVLMIKGNVGKVGIVPQNVPPPGPEGWVIGQSATALRLKPGATVDPRAIFMLLRSPFGQRLLGNIVLGASSPLISIRELRDLEIPLPSLAESASAVDILRQEDELQAKIDALSEQQAALAKKLWSIELSGASA